MDIKTSEELKVEIYKRDKLIEELEEKLIETEKKFNELNKTLENRMIERTVEVKRLIKQKSKFIDNLSHDLGTPLTPLVTLLPTIKEQIENEDVKDMIETCIRNVEYMKRIVDNTRVLAELSSTDFLLKKENLFEIINELEQKYEFIFKSYNIEIENNINKEIFIKTERQRLLKLFDHITSNAVNSMIEKGGKIIFESKPVKKEFGDFIQISISDTGVGLSREQTDHLFDAFYKTDDSRHKLDSTGLGLAICKSIVEKHSGKIWADSHGAGTGTTIHFTIPSSDFVYTRSFL
jgi:signal transduction histidine kinase